MIKKLDKVDERGFRDTLGRFASGVTVVTTRDAAGAAKAVTVSAFCSVSLEPPLVLFCLGKQAFHAVSFERGEGFAVNLLTSCQQELSNRFAREADSDWSGIETESWATGSPILKESLAALECMPYALHEAGDHWVMIGRVIGLGLNRRADAGPLLYYGGTYHSLAGEG